MQAPRPCGGIFLPEPECKKNASAAASVCLHNLFESCNTPTRRCPGTRTLREALAQQGCEGARQGGAWEYLELGPALVSLDSSMFQAAKHRRAAPSHKDPGAGAVAASNRHRMNHDSLETWPCVSLNAKSFFCLEGATSPAKPLSVPALNSTDFRFLFSSDCTASQAFASHFKAKTGVVPASAPGFFCSNLVSSSEAVYIYNDGIPLSYYIMSALQDVATPQICLRIARAGAAVCERPRTRRRVLRFSCCRAPIPLQCCVACPGLSDKASRPPSLAEWTADGNARAPARKEGRKEGGREGGKEGRKLKAVFQDTGHLLKVALQLYLLDLTYIRSQQACCALYIYMYTLSTIYIYIYTHETLEYHIPPHTGAQTGIVILLWGRRSALLPIPPPPAFLFESKLAHL